MSRTRVSAEQAQAVRDRCEEEILAPALEAVMREFLGLLRPAVLRSVKRPDEASLRAAGASAEASMPSYAEILAWWVTAAQTTGTQPYLDALADSWNIYSGNAEVPTVQQLGFTEYAQTARDRLSRTIGPQITDESYAIVRDSLMVAETSGMSRTQLANLLGERLSWEPPTAVKWRAEVARLNGVIDSRLDPLGQPGTPAREHARLNDPTIKALQEARSDAVLMSEANRSTWEVRAMRIARTEATAASNYGALTALHHEGWTAKEWLAALGPRTRPTHARASGQVVALDDAFLVGGFRLQMPGDQSAPAAEVVNCRCTVLGADLDGADEPAEEQTAPAAAPAVPKFDLRAALEAKNEQEIIAKIGTPIQERMAEVVARHGLTLESEFLYVSKPFRDGNNALTVSASIKDITGRRIGMIHRDVSYDDAGDLFVSNELFSLTPGWQGKGIATEMAQSLEEFYRANGIVKVKVHANIDVGGYTWAKQGFGWDTDLTQRYEVEALLVAVREEAVTMGDDLSLVNSWLSALTTDPATWPTPYDLAQYGYTPGAQWWPGKTAMLGKDWMGVKPLPPAP